MIQQCCAAGEIHTGTPAGRVEKVHGLDCYIAEPPAGTTPKGVVVVLPDVFGWELNNTRILADAYAERGSFLVYLPELQSGKALPITILTNIESLDEPGLLATLARGYHFARVLSYYGPFAYTNSYAVVKAKLYGFMRALRANQARHLPLGAAGFCWGGYWCFQLAHDEEAERAEVDGGARLPLVDAVFSAHPSQTKLPDDIAAIVKPTSVAAAELDTRYPRHDFDATKEILEQKSKEHGTRHEAVWYEGCHHGWAVRGRKEDPVEGKKGLEAQEQAVRWFTERFDEVRGEYAA